MSPLTSIKLYHFVYHIHMIPPYSFIDQIFIRSTVQPTPSVHVSSKPTYSNSSPTKAQFQLCQTQPQLIFIASYLILCSCSIFRYSSTPSFPLPTVSAFCKIQDYDNTSHPPWFINQFINWAQSPLPPLSKNVPPFLTKTMKKEGRVSRTSRRILGWEEQICK